MYPGQNKFERFKLNSRKKINIPKNIEKDLQNLIIKKNYTKRLKELWLKNISIWIWKVKKLSIIYYQKIKQESYKEKVIEEKEVKKFNKKPYRKKNFYKKTK